MTECLLKRWGRRDWDGVKSDCVSCVFADSLINQTINVLLLSSAFSPEQLVNAVQLATQFAIWMGSLSLFVEILGSIAR